MTDGEPKPETDEEAPAEAGAVDETPDAEEAEAVDAGAEEPDPLAEQAARIAELEAEAQALRDERLRALAEVENMRRRSERERMEASRYGAAGLARDLLGVADNLRRALASGGGEGLLEGIEMVERELAQAFSRHHIARIEAEGERFDHNRHQAMFELETADAEAGTVVQVVQEGYVLHDRLLRPAMVGVAKAPKPSEEAADIEVMRDEGNGSPK